MYDPHRKKSQDLEDNGVDLYLLALKRWVSFQMLHSIWTNDLAPRVISHLCNVQYDAIYHH